ncbi:MAG: alpha/beta hydrolase, partial [Bacteroidota bacterium]
MGGMIAQRLSLDHPGRVLSLTSISSSAFSGDPDIEGMSLGFLADYTRLAYHFGGLDTEETVVKASLAVQLAFSGDHQLHLDKNQFIRQILFEMRNRKGINSMVSAQHDATGTDRPNRYEELANSSVPSLVIHGKIDPVLSIEHAKKYTTMVPSAQSLFVEGMGHNLPIEKMDVITPVLIRHFQQSDAL